VVTATLTVDFLRPVPIVVPLRLTARVDRRDGRRWYLSGDLRLVQGDVVLARGNGVWIDIASKPALLPSYSLHDGGI
jgi:hypothetical protein